MSKAQYIIMTARTRMPGNCFGSGYYHKVAVVRLSPDFEGVPKMISERARGVEEIVYFQDRLYKGSTQRCAFAKALSEAKALCSSLNSRSK